MTRYVLAMAMLALGAAGVVWIAIEQRAAPTAAKAPKPTTAIAEPSATPSAEVQVADAGETAIVGVPPATYAAWSVVRWGMSAAEVETALKQAGVVVVDSGDKRLRAKSGAWDVTIELGASHPTQIVVTAANLSKEEAQAAVAKAKERAPATTTTDHTERRWKKDEGALTTFVTHADGTTATMREVHVRERAPGGAIGFAGLRWGMSTQEVVGLLTARGYAAHAAKDQETVSFSKGDVEGTASFNQFGLRHVEIAGPMVDGGAARAKELESSLGKPASVEVSTKTQHVDNARLTSIDVEVTETQPGGVFTVVETYRPKN